MDHFGPCFGSLPACVCGRGRALMTPLERSRFASEAANGPQTGALDSARAWLNSARQNIASHHGWTSGCADCLQDGKSCIIVIFCQACVTGQLAERVWRRKYLCATVATLLSICALASLTERLMPLPCAGEAPIDYTYGDDDSQFVACASAYYSSGWYVSLAVLGWLFCLGSCVITAMVRAHIRRRDQIPATVCEGADDYCCACCCLPCTQCQIIRHELGRTSAERYRFLSADGSADGAMMV